jgi:hypothetical protein
MLKTVKMYGKCKDFYCINTQHNFKNITGEK